LGGLSPHLAPANGTDPPYISVYGRFHKNVKKSVPIEPKI
jgi:hypothetical protein